MPAHTARPTPAEPATAAALPTLWADHALTDEGWARAVTITIARDGSIDAVRPDSPPPTGSAAIRCGVLLPALANVHSHAFQHALAGLTERRGAHGSDSFWTWRERMFAFLPQLGPAEVEAISAYVFMTSLQAGYAAIAEFHYLHHQPDGTPYSRLAEMSERIAAAAATTGIGLSLLPVLYQQGGCDGRALGAGQQRFGNDLDRLARLHQEAVTAVRHLPADCLVGVAPHSLRAVTPTALNEVLTLAPQAPVHLHLSEQRAEVDEVLHAYGQRPVAWLLDHAPVDARWCLIHATQMTADETLGLAASGAVVGLCPETEANLGDGIFDGARFLNAGGRFGIGSDSNVRISLTGELRLLEYSQRLQERSRAVLAAPEQSTGRALLAAAAAGGAQATGRHAGALAPGRLADLVALNADAPALAGLHGDNLLDAYVFAGDDTLVTDVWSAGRHLVRQGRHIRAGAITEAFVRTMRGLRARL